MSKPTINKILGKYGNRATDSELERSVYARDLAPVPALLVNPLFKTLPDIVVRPESTAEVAEIMQLAYQDQIPVTPRAGASTVYFDSVPTRNGILMDLNLIKGIISLDQDHLTVRVKAATTWSELDEYLSGYQLACKSIPSSAPAATIGGWFCMMGHGIGSLKYGSLLSQVRSIEVVLPDGSIHTVSEQTSLSLEWFVGSEGTLGIVTELELEVRHLTSMKHFLLQLSDNLKMLQVMQALIKAPVIPYNMHFSDQACLNTAAALGLLEPDIAGGCLLAIDYEGDERELQLIEGIISQLANSDAVVNLPGESAQLEWQERFKALRLKRGGPSVLGAEIWLPMAELPAYLDEVKKMSNAYDLKLMSYGHVVTPEHVTIMTMFYADETRTIPYIVNLSLVKKIQDIGHRYGGHPYGVGLWNTPYINRIHRPCRLKELRRRKALLDKRGIMNPGKVYGPPWILNPFNFAVGMNLLAGVRKFWGKGW